MKYETRTVGRIMLNANELPYNLSESIMQEVKDALDDIAFNRYPDEKETELLETYGKHIGIDSACLLAGNGSDQMLGYLIGTFLGHDKTLFTNDPDFSMYDYYAASYETTVKKYKSDTYSVDEFIAMAKQENADMILFSNPHNPTGRCLSIQEIEKIVNSFEIPVVVDEAYIEFADEQSAVTLIDTYENLFVTRTLSKAYGLAGLRVGFLIGNASRMKLLKENFVPYALNALSMRIACIVLQYAEAYEGVIEEIKKERERVYHVLEKIQGMQVLPSKTNFLYCQLDDKERLLKKFAERGIVLRNYNDASSFRITIGSKADNDEVIAVLEAYSREVM